MADNQQRIQQLQAKIQKTMELIRIEQNAKEEHVNEYLKFTTAPDTDKQQVQRIKAMFERKNMKSTQMLAHYQKKLDGYKRKVKETQSIVGSATARSSTGHKQVSH